MGIQDKVRKKVVRRPFRRGAAADFAGEIREGGRCGFSLEELVRATNLDPVTARAQLVRVPAVKPLYPRATFYLVIDPEHRRLGAPPVEWWIGDFFAAQKKPYYIGLLTAAALHGSSPQAIQVTQIVLEDRRSSIQIGRQRLQFTMKKNAADTPVMTPRGAKVPVKVATVEATFFDLIAYQRKLGGMPRLLDVIDGLDLGNEGMNLALAQRLDVRLLQRAGFILERIGKKRLAAKVERRLDGVRRQPARIQTSSDPHAPRIEANSWNVVGTWGARSGS